MPSRLRCSIVIPTRDSLAHLRLALSSVRQQKIREIEILVVDDGSVDDTSEWLEAQRLRWRQLRILRGAGRGPAIARNIAIAAARTRLVAFLDADDLWWPNKLARQLAFHERHPHVGLSFTDYLHVDGDSRTFGSCFQYWRFRAGEDGTAFQAVRDAEATLLGTNVVGTSTVMVRTADLHKAGGFSSDLPSASDWDLWLRIAAAAPVAATPATLATYLINRPGSVTSRAEARIEAIRMIMARYEDRRDAVFLRAQRLVRARLAEARADSHLSANQHFRALIDRLQVLAMRPTVRTARATGSQARNVLRHALRPALPRNPKSAGPLR